MKNGLFSKSPTTHYGLVLWARAKITSHFKRRSIPPGGVAKVRNMPDIPALSRLARQAPQHFKFVNLFLREPFVAA